MDIRMIVKILAVLAIVALSYKMWGARSQLSIPRPYEGFGDDDDYEEDYESDYEEDYEEDDYEEDDYEDDAEEDYEMHGSHDSEDDMEEDYENDMEDDDMGDDDMEDDDYEVSAAGASKITRPVMPLLSPSSNLLPQPSIQAQDFAKYAPKELGAQNFLTATQWIGVNTQGSSLRNANYDIRANPVISKKDVGPWGQSTIDPDVYTKPLF